MLPNENKNKCLKFFFFAMKGVMHPCKKIFKNLQEMENTRCIILIFCNALICRFINNKNKICNRDSPSTWKTEFKVIHHLLIFTDLSHWKNSADYQKSKIFCISSVPPYPVNLYYFWFSELSSSYDVTMWPLVVKQLLEGSCDW